MTRGRELTLVQTEGRRFRGRRLELRSISGDRDSPLRVGIIVPKYTRSAVERNRVKRRLREIFRTEFLGQDTTAGREWVVFALPAAYGATFAELRAELQLLGARSAATTPE